MGQTDAKTFKKLAAESERAIDFLTVIGSHLKRERRHFDDAVVTHCIRLIHDYVDEISKDQVPGGNQGTNHKDAGAPP